jgi:hypothetical protein
MKEAGVVKGVLGREPTVFAVLGDEAGRVRRCGGQGLAGVGGGGV